MKYVVQEYEMTILERIIMLELSIVGKVFTCLFVAMLIILGTALWVGEERKAQWFRKRKKYSWFLRRGILGEILHFGYPCTVQGGIVTVVMFSLICIFSFLIVTYL